MKKSSTKIATILLASLLTVACFACGGPKKDPLDDPNKTNLSVWVPNIMADFFSDFETLFEEENSDINLKIVFKPESDLYGSLDSTLGTKTAPDIFTTLGGMIVPTLYKSGHLMDVDSIVTKFEDDLIDNAKINKKDADGKYHSLPLTGFASPVIFYNSDVFETMKTSESLNASQQAAVKEPETYAEFVALCDAIDAFGKQPLTGAFNSWHMPHLMQALHSRTMTVEAYSELLSTTGSENPFTKNQSSYAAGFDLLKQYRDDGIFETNFLGRNLTDADLQFKQGNALLRLGVSTDFNDLKEQMPFAVKAFYLPPSETVVAPRANAVFADVVCARKNTKYPAEVKRTMEFMLSDAAQEILAKYSMMPSIKNTDVSEMPTVVKNLYNEIAVNGANDFYQSWSFVGIDVELLLSSHAVLGGSKTSLQAATAIATFYNDSK